MEIFDKYFQLQKREDEKILSNPQLLSHTYGIIVMSFNSKQI